jgi:uncharacterized membrane protein
MAKGLNLQNIFNKIKKLSLIDWVAIVFISVFSFRYIELGFSNYHYFETGMDLGGYTQALFNLSHFRLPFNTFKNMVMWGDHAHFIIAFFAPLYRLFPDARLILAIQALAVTLAGWPLYKISRLLVKNTVFSLAILYAYLAFIGIQFALNFDFHPNVLTGAAIVWFFYGLHFQKKYIFWTSLILGLMTREDAPPIFFMIGLYLFLTSLFKSIYYFIIRKIQATRSCIPDPESTVITKKGYGLKIIRSLVVNKPLMTALAVMFISFAYFCIVAYVVMPLWTTDHAALTYLDSDQKDPYNVVRGFFQYPKAIFENMTDTARKRATINTLFSSFGYLSLLSPLTYISSLTIFYSRFASADSYRWIINNHENANILPLLAIGAIYGAKNIKRVLSWVLSFSTSKLKKRTQYIKNILINITLIVLAIFLVYSVQINAWSDYNTPLYLNHEEHVMHDNQVQAHENAVKKVNEIIPKDDMIAVSGGFTAHLGNRKKIQNYPEINNSTQWLVLSTTAYSWPFSEGSMKHEIKVELNDPEFEKVWSEKEVYIFKRTVDRTNEPESTKTNTVSASDENGE